MQDVPAEPFKTPIEGEARSHQGSLRSKLVLSLAAIFLVFLFLDEIVRRNVIEPEFIALEQAGAIRDANRVMAALNSEVEHLKELASQYAMQIRRDPSVPVAAIQFDRAEVRTMAKSVWAVCVEPDGTCHWLPSAPQPGAAPQQGAMEREQTNRELEPLIEACQRSRTEVTSGLTRFGHDSLAIFAVVALDHPSKTSARTPTSRHLVVARQIDEEMREKLCRQTQVNFSLQPIDQLDPDAKTVVWQADQAVLTIAVQLSGIDGEKLARVCIQVPRDVTARAIRTTKLARNLFIFGSIAALLMLLVMLQRIVISPLAAIREHSNRVAEEGFATEPMLLTRNDEIGQLASAFDQMVRKLSDTQTQLTRASQAAGRSQVASSVIHNVGNVLTNINSLLDTASESLQGLRIGPLDKLADRLRTDRENEVLLAATPDYLEGLAGSLKSDQESILALLSTLHDNLCHIHDVIRDQQRHADPSIKSSRICLQEVLEEAIACCQARLDDDLISVEISGPLAIPIHSDRSLLLQAMINVIGNARHAMRDNVDRPRILSIEVLPFESSVRVRFRDNGCGMTNDTLQRVFDAHFTTRESGTGLGLHFCALTLKKLGGSIRAESDGPGSGATFVLELPRAGSSHPSTANLTSSASPILCATTS